MQVGLTSHIDLPQIAFWLFFVLFVAVCWWNRREDKREGYPMRTSPFDHAPELGVPAPPETPETYLLNEGGATQMPHHYPQPPTQARALRQFDGTPLAPTGNPLLEPLGPGAWVMRRDAPMRTEAGELVLQPMRLLHDWSISQSDADPRGMAVFDWRWIEVGVVRDAWIDQGAKILRLLEIELRGGGAILAPLYYCEINENRREVHLTALRRHQFAEMPMPASLDRITAREEDRLNAYWAAGKFYRDTDATDPPATAAVEGSLP